MNLNIEKKNAISAYKQADDCGKKILRTLFGEKIFNEKIQDRVKTFEDACEIKNVDPNTILPYQMPSNSFEKGINAMAKLMIIAEVLQEGWEADYTNRNQYKYYPWFEMGKAGFGFSGTDCAYVYSYSGVGSRLCFPTRELAEYFGKQFLPITNDFLNK